MMNDKFIELQATGVSYFSSGDEDVFFKRLGDLTCVKKVEGQYRTLYIDIDAPAVDEDSLRELLAIFKRYRVPLKQLAIFDCEEFASWFRNDKKAYWHKDIFGE